MDPLKRRVIKQLRSTNRAGNDQRDLFPETAIKHVLVQGTGEGPTTIRNCTLVIITATRAFRATAATSINSNHADVLATALNDFSERTKTAAQIRSYFNKPAALRKRIDRLFLRGPPRKPAIDVVPVAAN